MTVPVPKGAGALPPPGTVLHGIDADLREARLRGYAIAPEGTACDVRLQVGGRPVPFELRRVDRADLRSLHALAPGARVGFVVELDPEAWRSADSAGRVHLQIALNGAAADVPLVLDASTLSAWTRAARGWRIPDEREVWRLLAHVAASSLLPKLPRRERDWLQQVAQARGLDEALRHGDPSGRIAWGARAHVQLQSDGPLALQGWAYDADGTELPPTLECRNEAVAAEVRGFEDAELARQLDAPHAGVGIEVCVPATAWQKADEHGACRLQLRLRGRLVGEFHLDVAALRRERAALLDLAKSTHPRDRARALGRLRRLQTHVEAAAPWAQWSEEDGRELAALEASLAEPLVAVAAPTVAQPDAPTQAPPEVPVRWNLEGWQGLILHGWAADAQAGGEVFTLECNDAPVECLVLRTQRGDVSQALGLPNPYLGFEIQLPADIWALADVDGRCRLVLKVNGASITPEGLILDDAALERAVLLLPEPGQAMAPVDDPAGMRLRLIALPLVIEHVQARGGQARLGASARERLQAIGDRPELRELIHADVPLRAAFAEREAAQRQRRVWRLQRLFNAAIERRPSTWAGRLGEALEEVLADPDCEGAARQQWLFSLVPFACGDAALARIAGMLSSEVVAWQVATGDNWARTIQLALAVHAGDLQAAARMLQQVADAPLEGWINTECVALAVSAAVDEGVAGSADADAIGRAYAALLAAWPGGLWSRLHDQALVDASARLLHQAARQPDLAAAAIARSVLRAHGLVPRLWQQLPDSDHRGPATAAGLTITAARRLFRAARDTCEALASGRLETESVVDALAALEAADRLGSDDARGWMRELALQLAAAAAARPSRVDDAPALLAIAADLLGAGETARIDLFPGPHAFESEAGAHRAALYSPDQPSLWPTDIAVGGGNRREDNRLRLIGDPHRLEMLRAARLHVICVVRNERAMLPHFLAHYRRLGATAFIFIDNLSDDDTRPYLESQPDVVVYSAGTDYRDSHFGVAWQQAVLAAYAAGHWALLADADEFLTYPGCEHQPLPDLLDALEAGGHDAARTLMIDFYPREALRDVDFAQRDPAASADWMDRRPFVRWHLGGGLYSNGPTWLSALRHRLIPDAPPNAFTAQKVALLRWRPWVRLSEGLHYVSGVNAAPQPLYFAHYKYHAGFREKIVREVERKQHFDGASEYAHYLHMVARDDATLYDAAVSVQVQASADLARVVDPVDGSP